MKGASAIRSYVVRGTSPYALTEAMLEKGSAACRIDGAVACVWMRVSWVKTYRYSGGSCRITRVTVTQRYTVWLPQWTGPSPTYPDLLTWWRAVLSHLAWHEGEHIRIEKAAAARLRRDLTGQACSRAGRIESAWKSRVRAAQDAFDEHDAAWAYPAYAGPGGWFGDTP